MTDLQLCRYKKDGLLLSGLEDLIRSNKVDIFFTAVEAYTKNSFTFNLTIPFGQIHGHFLVPKPKLRTSFWAPVTQFTPVVWISIIIMLITQSIFVCVKARLLPTRVSKSNLTKFAELTL